MKQAAMLLSILFVVGCSSVQNVGKSDALKIAAWKAIGREQAAWYNHDTAALPAGMDSLVTLKKIRAHVENIAVAGSEGTVTTTYWYTGTFSTPEGQREGTLTVQRRLHFRSDDRGEWSPSAPAEEIARNSQWSSERGTGS